MMTSIEKPFSNASENNKGFILEHLQRVFGQVNEVLEIGSGTGQHCVHFAKHLSHLRWQPSDLISNHQGIQMWLDEAALPNVSPLIELDVTQENWPTGFDAAFTANTIHIMPWEFGKVMIEQVGTRLPVGGRLVIYGPFKYQGEFTTPSNAQFDVWLKERGAHQGIRDFEKIKQVAESVAMQLEEDNAMPANNQLVVFTKS